MGPMMQLLEEEELKGTSNNLNSCFSPGILSGGVASDSEVELLLKQLAEVEESLKQERVAFEDERRRHRAIEEYWRRRDHEQIASVHAADCELIRRGAIVEERE